MHPKIEMALKIKEEAERKFAEKDYDGAKWFAERAKDVFPNLSFLSLFITVINIFLSKETLVNGQPDWYGVMGLKKPATIKEICETYFNLFAVVKGGRNNVIGTEEALRIISEAFRVLTGTFWVMCPRCHLYFQYFNSAENKSISCCNCREVFVAVPLPYECYPVNPYPMSLLKDRRSDEGECSSVRCGCGNDDVSKD